MAMLDKGGALSILGISLYSPGFNYSAYTGAIKQVGRGLIYLYVPGMTYKGYAGAIKQWQVYPGHTKKLCIWLVIVYMPL